MITFALTSCGRPDLLEKTMDSFIKFNTYPINKFIIIEDSCIENINYNLKIKYNDLNILWIDNDCRLGQIKSIDKMYSYIETEYIFHCEEDWLFTDYGFIEDSIKILENNNKILNVWIRDKYDTNNHPIEESIFICDDIQYSLVSLDYMGIWNGFTFNPGVRRLNDYKLINNYDSVGHEAHISIKYKDMGYRSAILNKKYVEHIGWDRHINDI